MDETKMCILIVILERMGESFNWKVFILHYTEWLKIERRMSGEKKIYVYIYNEI